MENNNNDKEVKLKKKRVLEPIVDAVGEFLAFFTVALILFLYINARYNFLPANVTDLLSKIREVAIVSVVGLSGLEFALKGRLVLTIIFLVLLAGVVVFMFFPNSIPGWIPG